MNQVKAKQLRISVALAMYGEHATDAKFSNEDMRDIRKDPTFKKIYRARKKNETTKPIPVNQPTRRVKEYVNDPNKPFAIWNAPQPVENKNFLGNSAGNKITVMGKFKWRRIIQVAKGKDGLIHRIFHHIAC